jgi:hypothetical protein
MWRRTQIACNTYLLIVIPSFCSNWGKTFAYKASPQEADIKKSVLLFSLNIEQEVHDIAIFDHIFFSL